MTVLRAPERWPMPRMVERDFDVEAYDRVFAALARNHGPAKAAEARAVMARYDDTIARLEFLDYAHQVSFHLKMQRRAIDAAVARGELDAFGAGLAWRRASAETMNAPTALAVENAWTVANDPKIAAWVEAALGLKPRADAALWKRLGIGVGRATINRDGTWEPFADGDVPREIAGRGVPVLTIPVVPGGLPLSNEGVEAIEIYAVELAPGVPARATGRVYALTGLAIGLGLDTYTFDEWRRWSRGLAVVGSPLDWVRAHRAVRFDGAVSDRMDEERAADAARREEAQARARGWDAAEPEGSDDGPPSAKLARDADKPELLIVDDAPMAPAGPSVMVAPFLGDPAGDGMPCVWLADIDADLAPGDPEEDYPWRAREIDRLLLDSDPIVASDDATALAIKARVAAARKRAFPPNPKIEIDVTEETKGEAA